MPDDRELVRLRAQIDAVNERLVATLHERAQLVRAIGAWKRAHGVAAIDPTREAAMLASLTSAGPADGYSREQLAAILRAVFAASRDLVARA